MSSKIIEICPKCQGTGEEFDTATAVFSTICTFGILPALDCLIGDGRIGRQDCRVCKGKGRIVTKEIIDE